MTLSELEIRYNLNHTLIRENGELVATFSSNVSTDEGFKIAEALQQDEYEFKYYDEKAEKEDLEQQVSDLKTEIIEAEKENLDLEDEIERLKEEIEALKDELEFLKKK